MEKEQNYRKKWTELYEKKNRTIEKKGQNYRKRNRTIEKKEQNYRKKGTELQKKEQNYGKKGTFVFNTLISFTRALRVPSYHLKFPYSDFFLFPYISSYTGG